MNEYDFEFMHQNRLAYASVAWTAGRVAILNTRKHRSVYEEKSDLRNSRWLIDCTVSRVVYTLRQAQVTTSHWLGNCGVVKKKKRLENKYE